MTIVRVGSTRKFAEGWDKAFGKKRRTKKAAAGKGSTAKAKKSAKAKKKSSTRAKKRTKK